VDLSTIDSKVRNQVYCSAEEFVYDVNLIFKNCYRYNPPGTPVHGMGRRLQEVFEQKWKEKPVPPTAKKGRRASGSFGSEEESDGSVSDSSLDPGMAMLQKQMELMKQQMDEMSKQKKKLKAHERRLSHSGKRSLSSSKGHHKKIQEPRCRVCKKVKSQESVAY